MLEIICASCIALSINVGKGTEIIDSASINKVVISSVIQKNVLLDKKHFTKGKLYASDYRREVDTRERHSEDRRDRDDRDSEYQSDYQREADEAKERHRTEFLDEDYEDRRDRLRERRGDEEYAKDRRDRHEDYEDRRDRSREDYERGESRSFQDLQDLIEN